MRVFIRAALGAVAILAAAAPASASQQVFHFISPTFGGNALNGAFLLNTAQAQGFGAASSNNTPDLTGLDNALSNLGSNLSTGTGTGGTTPIIVIPSGTGTIP